MKKPALLMLHGALGCGRQFDSLRLLLESSYEVIAPDFEGHGSRKSGGEFSIRQFANNVLEVLKSSGTTEAFVFGYSMGGYAKLAASLIEPSRFKKIVTLGTKFDWTADTAEAEVKKLNPEIIEQKVPHFAARLRELHAGQDWKEVVRKTGRMMTALANGERLTDEQLSRIKVPVTIGIGDKDVMVTIEESKQASSCIPGGQVKILSNVKHPLEQVDEEILVRFIEESFLEY